MEQNNVLSRHPQLLDSFFNHLKLAPRRVLMLDYDGTLAPFHLERAKATPYPGVREILSQILRAGHTRLVIVSGRHAQEVISLLDLPEPLEVWGSHGWELCRADGAWKSSKLATAHRRP